MSRALLSVSDKTGIEDFAKGLVAKGYEILSTGGTCSRLEAAGVPVTQVADYTRAPEVFGGRVKTLHPMIHGGILGRRGQDDQEAQENGIEWIDMVVVNLYPFEASVAGGADLSEAVEKIDIGGPTMIRSAAKNHKHVTVVCDPSDYNGVLEMLENGELSEGERARLATKAFGHTALYDGMISGWLSNHFGMTLQERALPVRRIQSLRYGENPHQSASFYSEVGADGRSLARAKTIQGKPLSFNNLADLDGALRAAFEYTKPAAVVVKHMNPCGAATHEAGISEAFKLALSADPVSAYGGILAFNRPLEAEDVRNVFRARTFFEVLAAPGFTEEALGILAKREKLRVLELPEDWAESRPSGTDARRVQGGWLLQDWDLGVDFEWKVATKRAPTQAEAEALRFTWAACRNVKSNAIALGCSAQGGFVLNGVGAGQMSRVDSVRIAIQKATRTVEGSVLASDAFFPFADGVDVAAQAGVKAIIQPGGSIRDDEVIEAADRAGLAMVFTGARHFRH
ncbi:MAG: bifunctional phosphoribosylaminoimidazolecarboxamide formyltransferase/IMP cyclohydrolase [Myxococcota bacterium]|nr:bifunctional phosphoribosylaminoimidazolecarboxamide formyltransferase/IMP cyclohydrolase [Myxococcota bacterium]